MSNVLAPDYVVEYCSGSLGSCGYDFLPIGLLTESETRVCFHNSPSRLQFGD